MDIVVANSGDNTVQIIHGYIDRSLVKAMRLSTGDRSKPNSVVTGDFNSDNQIDIAIINSGTNQLGIFLKNTYGFFSNQVTYSTDSVPLSAAIGDFNNDSLLDIVVANYQSSTIGVFLGCGNGSFLKQKTFSTGANSRPNAIAVGDFNNDHTADIIFTNNGTNSIGVLLGFGNGTFDDMESFSTDYGSFPFLICVGDFNNDKKLDVGVANKGFDSMKVFIQTC